jgi:hypothetical protein
VAYSERLQDVRKFAGWFGDANHEPLRVGRVTVRDQIVHLGRDSIFPIHPSLV